MPFQVLSLSGGGYLGLYTISILAELEKKLEKPISTYFDLIAGTSIGGVIALGLSAEKSAEEIKKAFEGNGTKIFSNRPAPRTKRGELLDFARCLFSSKYDAKELRKTIIDIVGEKTLIGDLKHFVIIPTVNLTKGMPQVFKTSHHPNFQLDHTRNVVNVALATSAAPTYFPIAEMEDELFVDGGVFANSPDILALHEAEHFFKVPIEDIRMLSIGTTTTQYSVSHVDKLNLGIWGWRRRLAQTMISSQQMDAYYILSHKLGKNYLRVDEILSKDQERDLGLDVATEDAQRTIRGIASGSFQSLINNELLKKMLSHEKPIRTFYHKKKTSGDKS